MFCKGCGHQLSADANFCSQCGTRVTDGPDDGARQRADDLGIQTAPEKCAYCDGDGTQFATRCPACGGEGSVLVAQPARQCGTCDGTGNKFAQRCEVCDGAGWAHVVRL